MTPLSFFILLFTSLISMVISRQMSVWKQKKSWSKTLKEKSVAQEQTHALEGSLSQLTNKIESFINRYPYGKRMTTWIADAGASVGLTLGNIILVTVLLQFSAWNFSGILGMPTLGMMVLALFVEFGILTWILKKGASTEAMEREFPTVLETIAKVYRLHPDLKEGTTKVAGRTQDPRLKRVFTEALQLSRGGLTIIDALEHTSQKLLYPPLQFMIAVLKSRLQLGGNIPHFLEEMAHSLKTRRETERQIASTVFQNKISALIVSVLVPLIFTLSFLFSEQYRDIIFDDQLARFVIVSAMVWWAIGVVFISRVVRVKI